MLKPLGQLPIPYGETSHVIFSPSGKRAIVQWPKRDSWNAMLIDASTGVATLEELDGPWADWGSGENPEPVLTDSFRPTYVPPYIFNTDPEKIGDGDRVTLVDHRGEVLHPDWHDGLGQGSLPRHERPESLTAVRRGNNYELVPPGRFFNPSVTLDPVSLKVLLTDRQTYALWDIAGDEARLIARPPGGRSYVLVPGQDYLIATQSFGGGIHGEEPNLVYINLTDLTGKVLERFPLAFRRPEVSITDVIIRASPHIILVTDGKSFHVFGFALDPVPPV